MTYTPHEFEDEVRRIARLLWPAGKYGGSEMVDGQERDGIFETEDFFHCVESTISRQKDKAEKDFCKLAKLTKKLNGRRGKFAKGWFVTFEEPTAEQRSVFKSNKEPRLTICSYDQFRSKLADITNYLNLRQSYPFGSLEDPETGEKNFNLKYIPLDILDQSGAPVRLENLKENLGDGGRAILTGDYGAGKSATAKDIFLHLANKFRERKSLQFPLLLNLRDHHGQNNPVEAIERHARNIGFADQSSLVRAWRAGHCVLLLDGFDEIASAGWSGKVKRFRDLRYQSMELLRKIIGETPKSSGVLITGRAHFFDSDLELKNALGGLGNFKIYSLAEFSLEQVKEFLKGWGLNTAVPEWLPTRPLLLGYLATKNLIAIEGEMGEEVSSPVIGWNILLEKISEREAKIEAGIDPGTVRNLIESLATMARVSVDGLGPLSADEIIDCFKDVCGHRPDDRGIVVQQNFCKSVCLDVG
ncbi:MAG: NACHT domain-containing protein [Nitrospinae bacterium]|nr:NACHT domain-containing protein [Nitrospinota bacterium]